MTTRSGLMWFLLGFLLAGAATCHRPVAEDPYPAHLVCWDENTPSKTALITTDVVISPGEDDILVWIDEDEINLHLGCQIMWELE